jgi:hypothetical protein
MAGLRQTAAGSMLVQPLTAAPDLDGWAIVERLLKDLAPLDDRVWLVIDDVHELGPEALAQLELLLMRAPEGLRFVLVTRHDVRLGLHRLRLKGELVEVRGPDLRFTVAEARELFASAGVELPEAVVEMLHERTEGWVAGLRLAALSLVGHPDPARFAEQFSGTERTVAEYLLAEVLDRQPEPVRRLLLRTSILDSVNGELAHLLTGASGGERILQDLEAANAFVVALDGVGPGSATTDCSPTCCSWNCAAPNRTRSAGCTGSVPGGWPSTDSRCSPSDRPWPHKTGSRPPACSPITGLPCIWTGRLPSFRSSSPGSPPRPGWRMVSWPYSAPSTSCRRGRWRQPSGIWAWRNGRRRRWRRNGRRSCCWGSPGCFTPASAGTFRRYRRAPGRAPGGGLGEPFVHEQRQRLQGHRQRAPGWRTQAARVAGRQHVHDRCAGVYGL